MITLAVVTGIPVSEWAKEGARGIETAFEVWQEINKPSETDSEPPEDGRQYSG